MKAICVADRSRARPVKDEASIDSLDIDRNDRDSTNGHWKWSEVGRHDRSLLGLTPRLGRLLTGGLARLLGRCRLTTRYSPGAVTRITGTVRCSIGDGGECETGSTSGRPCVATSITGVDGHRASALRERSHAGYRLGQVISLAVERNPHADGGMQSQARGVVVSFATR